MKMSVGDRIRSLRREKNWSQPVLAKQAGVTQSTISDLENNKKSTSAENMESIAEALGTTTSYLINGNSKSQYGSVEAWDSKTPLEDDEVEIKFFKDFKVACGSGTIGEALKSEWRRLRVPKSTLRNLGISKDNCVAMTAEGGSMKPTINDGDTVYVDLGRKTVKDEKIFAICHGGLFKFKRLYNLPFGGIRIVSDNHEEYDEEHLTAEQIKEQEFEIIGWAWSWQRTESW
ncbi:TPA: XRE family transcriptional regulator [Acinetobacter nosocomialis]|nr:S24 family peptidase [Acinetobacter baumannii]MCZ2455998.1 helix-turn-helix domain-containing protein [Acinetobacter baumannii]MDC4859575.1 helix-turn-helix domain-containing protein [Acinetobacter baumannii]MDH2594397.1 S24 family peptidase [Acinetobacter baumannii]